MKPMRFRSSRSRFIEHLLSAAIAAIFGFGALLTASAQQVAPTPYVLASGDAKAKVALQKTIEALGGDAYLHVVDMSQKGRSYGFHHGESVGAGAPYWRFTRFPDKDRIEFTPQRDVITVHNGDKGYDISYKGTAPEEPKLLADFLRRREHSLDTVLRQWIAQPTTTLLYAGSAIAEQKPAEVVTVLGPNHDSVTLYLDPRSHLPIKKSYTWRDTTDGLKDTEDEVYDAYKLVSGIMTPHNVTRFYNGDIASQRFIAEAKYNQSLPESMFDAHTTYDPLAPRNQH